MKFEEIKKLFVVGDRLNQFSSHQEVITITDLEKIIDSQVVKEKKEKYIIFIGQGICPIHINNLFNKVNEFKLHEHIAIHLPDNYRKSDARLTHKNKSNNIMISEPLQFDDLTYVCSLILEDTCAEMSDHITGQHIPGMVLVEAARQMVIAVTEKYFISNQHKRKVNFVTHSMNIIFNNFIFPLPLCIKYKILEIKQGKNNNLTSTASITFFQNNIIATEIIFKFSTVDSILLNEKESYMADQTIKSYLKELHN